MAQHRWQSISENEIIDIWCKHSVFKGEREIKKILIPFMKEIQKKLKEKNYGTT